MIRIKTPREIELLAEGGRLLAKILDALVLAAKPGVKTSELDGLARDLTRDFSVVPAFLDYAPGGHDPFPAAVCLSVNDEIVHGVPGDRVLQEGDIIGLDMGIVYEKKFFLDSARTVPVGVVSEEARRLLEVTGEALKRAIAAAVVGHTTGHIGQAVEDFIESQEPLASGERFGIVRELVGHGVGFDVHEDPQVPNHGRAGSGARLVEGLVIAIEPMITIGEADIETAEDGWTIVTASGQLAAQQEHTVAVTAAGPRVLT